MLVSGELPLAETQRACRPAGQRVFGWRRFFPVLYFFGMPLLVLAGSRAVGSAGGSDIARYATGAALLVILIAAFSPLYRMVLRQALSARGVLKAYVIDYEVTGLGLRMRSDIGETVHYWRGIQELALTKDHWLFLSLGMAYVLPRRFFSDRAAEKAFVKAAWDNLDEAAQLRNPATAAFLAN